MINFISGKYCVPPDVLSAADNHLLRGDSRDVIGWVRQRLLGEWRSWREVLREGRKQLIPVLHLKKFMLVYGHVGATPPHPHAQIRQKVIDKEVSEQESLQRGERRTAESHCVPIRGGAYNPRAEQQRFNPLIAARGVPTLWLCRGRGI